MAKPKIATTSLAGCFGCHMSLLDIDERILAADRAGRVRPLARSTTSRRSPAGATSASSRAAAATRRTSRCCSDFREHCDVLVAVGDCAIMGGMPAMRNTGAARRSACEEAYLRRPDGRQPQRPHPRRPRAPAAARQGLSLPRGREDRLLPARLSALGGHDLGRAGRAARRQGARAALRARQVRLRPTGEPMSETTTKRIVIEPVTRVEGHGKVTILLDEDNRVEQARLHIVEFRGFERFIQGRPYWEVPVLVQRLCGICPVSHHLCAAKAMDGIVGVDRLHADGGEDAPADALRADVPVATPCTSSTSPRPTCCSASTRRSRSATSSASLAEHPELAVQARDDAQVRPGDHRGDRRQEDPRHRRDPRRHQQEPLARRARRAARRASTRCSTGRADAVALARDYTLRNLEELAGFGIVPLEPPVAGARRRRDGPLRRRRCGRSTPTAATILDQVDAGDYLDGDRRGGALLVLHEVPLHPDARPGGRLVPRRPAGAGQHLRLHRHAARPRRRAAILGAHRRRADATPPWPTTGRG